MKQYPALLLLLTACTELSSVSDSLGQTLVDLTTSLNDLSDILQGKQPGKKTGPLSSYALILQQAEDEMYAAFLKAGERIAGAYQEAFTGEKNFSYQAISSSFIAAVSSRTDEFSRVANNIISNTLVAKILQDATLAKMPTKRIIILNQFQQSLEKARDDYKALLEQQKNMLLDESLSDQEGTMISGLRQQAIQELQAGIKPTANNITKSLKDHIGANAKSRFTGITDILKKELIETAKKVIDKAKDDVLEKADGQVTEIIQGKK